MNENVMNLFSYGMYIVTSDYAGKDNGCIANTVFQITSEPVKVAAVLNKSGLTHDMILESRRFSVSIISEHAPFSLIKHFGFRSGKGFQNDKFTGIYSDDLHSVRVKNGNRVIINDTIGYLSANVVDIIDCGTHDVFIGEVTDSAVFSVDNPATYSFYLKHIKNVENM